MCRKLLLGFGLFASVLLAAPAAVRAQGDYLDSEIVRVKPDKVAEFEVIAKKFADANRKANGDRWLAEVAVYGEGNIYIFTSRRGSYADIDKGNDMFMGAVYKTYGKEAGTKLLNDFNNCLVGSRNELRRRRPDLSGKMPADPQALNKMVGESRVLRTITVRVRPGREAEFEDLLKDINSHAESNPNAQPVLVSQTVEGSRNGTSYYITFFRTSLGGFDQNPSLKDFMGEEGMARIAKTISEVEAGSESNIYRFSPELSNPPKEVAEVAADYWNPKPVMATSHPKPKPAAGVEPTSASKPAEKPNK